ncbi:MAG: FeoA family protein [Thermodesulfobacteriota bacterium]|nr:FeoA family protein [Thermodesulfobacteriota bacterium]
MPLSIVQAGIKVRLISVDSGCDLQNRLTAMGLIPGVEIKVLKHSMHGPLIIEVKGSRIMLGRGMAQKILVG